MEKAKTVPAVHGSERIAAVVVLFNPMPELLDRLLQTVCGQVGKMYLIDNSPFPKPAISQPGWQKSDLFYKALGENTGIATAQNIGIRQALEDGFSHVLLLDQDSALPQGMVAKLLEAEQRLLLSGMKVAAVGPAFIHENTGLVAPAVRHGFLHVKRTPVDINSREAAPADYLISSGSLIRASVLREVGPMMDELFIDWVDIEWGLRARSKGFQSFVVPGANMQHTIGDKATHALGRQINLHDDVRNYYIVRNATYLLRLRTMGWAWRTVTLLKIPQYVIFYSWHSPHAWRSLRLLFRGFRDGVAGRVGRID